MKTCSETFQFEKDLKWENPARVSIVRLWRMTDS